MLVYNMKCFSIATELPNTEPSFLYVSVLFFLNLRDIFSGTTSSRYELLHQLAQLLVLIYYTSVWCLYSNGLRWRHPDCKAGNLLQCLPRFKMRSVLPQRLPHTLLFMFCFMMHLPETAE